MFYFEFKVVTIEVWTINIARVKTVNVPFFMVRKMCMVETSESKSDWATSLPIFSACIASFCFYAPYDHDSVCGRKLGCCRSLQILSTSFLKLWKILESLELTLSTLRKIQKMKFLLILSQKRDFLLFTSTWKCPFKRLQKNFHSFKNDAESIWRFL